ncbi:LRR and NB-ARC domain disease resistance protein [Quillaja saponaria]|uniref:LRR and NB-ARC domain disease resistance protein n=1 Tax=Quillaja saponaria TaxID=32244 RepID=A0AAD7KZ92_QUISA|nr:LRR and NB-ARC domain disease resistance protein [Quillaja saponaria]
MVRPKDSIWKHAENLKGRFKCNYCGLEFAGGATRIKSHLSGIKGQGIDKCNEVPEHVRAAAFEVADGSNKRARPLVGSSNIEGSANSAYAQGMQNLDEISTYDSLDENMKILKEKLEDLICQEADIKRKLFAIESLPGKKRKSEVDDWLRDVNRRKQQVFGIETHIRKLTQEVTKLAERNLPEILTFDDANHSGGEVLLQAEKLGRLSKSLENLAKSRNNVLKECFLCCAFYLGNKKTKTEYLIMRLADEGLIDGTKSLGGQFEEGLGILHQLQNSELLEVESNNVRMDKQSRAVAMSIKEGSFMNVVTLNIFLL